MHVMCCVFNLSSTQILNDKIRINVVLQMIIVFGIFFYKIALKIMPLTEHWNLIIFQ